MPYTNFRQERVRRNDNYLTKRSTLRTREESGVPRVKKPLVAKRSLVKYQDQKL